MDAQPNGGIVQRVPEQEMINHPDPRTGRQEDEALLDALGMLAFGIGISEAADGNPEAGAQWALGGLAAIGGPRVLRAYFESN